MGTIVLIVTSATRTTSGRTSSSKSAMSPPVENTHGLNACGTVVSNIGRLSVESAISKTECKSPVSDLSNVISWLYSYPQVIRQFFVAGKKHVC